jgi:prepilin-type N-terminal cleavage/methylation domain-containing protein
LNKGFSSLQTPQRSFTLLELIIVIVILGILATLGYTQYTLLMEYHRTAEAKVTIGSMRQLATEYYLKNGSLDNIQNSDAGVDNTCTSTNFYRYYLTHVTATSVYLESARCTSAGRAPNATRPYRYYLVYWPGGQGGGWCCQWLDDLSGCFGLPP